MRTLALILIPAAVLFGAAWIVLAAGGGAQVGRDHAQRRLPVARIGLVAAFVLLGLLVAPRLLGFTFLFLPLVMGRWARRRRGRPAPRDDPS